VVAKNGQTIFEAFGSFDPARNKKWQAFSAPLRLTYGNVYK
jgi:hypothetical protein